MARRENKLNEVAEKCRSLGATDVLVLPTDLSSVETSAGCVEKTVQHFKREIANARTFTSKILQINI